MNVYLIALAGSACIAVGLMVQMSLGTAVSGFVSGILLCILGGYLLRIAYARLEHKEE